MHSPKAHRPTQTQAKLPTAADLDRWGARVVQNLRAIPMGDKSWVFLGEQTLEQTCEYISLLKFSVFSYPFTHVTIRSMALWTCCLILGCAGPKQGAFAIRSANPSDPLLRLARHMKRHVYY